MDKYRSKTEYTITKKYDEMADVTYNLVTNPFGMVVAEVTDEQLEAGYEIVQ